MLLSVPAAALACAAALASTPTVAPSSAPAVAPGLGPTDVCTLAGPTVLPVNQRTESLTYTIGGPCAAYPAGSTWTAGWDGRDPAGARTGTSLRFGTGLPTSATWTFTPTKMGVHTLHGTGVTYRDSAQQFSATAQDLRVDVRAQSRTSGTAQRFSTGYTAVNAHEAYWAPERAGFVPYGGVQVLVFMQYKGAPATSWTYLGAARTNAAGDAQLVSKVPAGLNFQVVLRCNGVVWNSKATIVPGF